MVRITSKEIIDVVSFTDDKIIVAEKLLTSATGYKTSYYILNLKTLEKEVVTKNAYLIRKFGNSAFQKISESISNFTDCEAAVLPNKNVFVIFSNGQCALFDSEGEMLWNKTLTYKEKPVTCLAPDGDYIWCCCEEEDCVIRYLIDSSKLNLDLRIGSREAGTFSRPCFVSADGDGIYVCCRNKLRRISKSDFTVSDVSEKLSGLKRFYRFGKYSLICTSDGAYIGE